MKERMDHRFSIVLLEQCERERNNNIYSVITMNQSYKKYDFIFNLAREYAYKSFSLK